MIRLQLSHLDLHNAVFALEEMQRETTKRCEIDGWTITDRRAYEMLTDTLRNIRYQVPTNFQWPK